MSHSRQLEIGKEYTRNPARPGLYTARSADFVSAQRSLEDGLTAGQRAVLRMQQTHGNQFVRRMLARQSGAANRVVQRDVDSVVSADDNSQQQDPSDDDDDIYNIPPEVPRMGGNGTAFCTDTSIALEAGQAMMVETSDKTPEPNRVTHMQVKPDDWLMIHGE